MTDPKTPVTGNPQDDSLENIDFKNMLGNSLDPDPTEMENLEDASEEKDTESQKDPADIPEEDSAKTEEEGEEEGEEGKKSVTEVIGEINDNEGESDFRLMPEKDFQVKTKEMVLPTLLKFFRPELINRFDDLIFFHPLRKIDLKQIVEIMIREPREMLREKNIEIRLSEEAKLFLADKGYNPAFGARPLRRAIQEYVEDPLSDHLIRENFVSGDTIFIDLGESKDTLEFQKDVSDAGDHRELDPFAAMDEKSEKIKQAIYEFDENGEIILDDAGMPTLKKAEDGESFVETDELGRPKFDTNGIPLIRNDENGEPLLVIDLESISAENSPNAEEGEDIAAADMGIEEEVEETDEKGKGSFFSKIMKGKEEEKAT